MIKSGLGKESKILIVDDEKDITDYLERFLKRKGYPQVQSTKTGEEALNIIQKEGVNLVLLDIKLPGMGGIEVLRKIKEINKDATVIMITGVHDEEIGRLALQEGAFDYITKPFDLDYLELSVLAKIITTA